MQTIMKTGKLKRRLALFVAVIMTLTLWTAMPLQASADTSGDYTYTVNEDGSTVTITRYNGSETEVTVPATLDGKSVTTIGTNVFQRNTSLTSIIVSEGITTIIYNAFRNESVQTVDIPASATSILSTSFSWGTPSLRTVNVNAENPNYLSKDGMLFSKDEQILMCYPANKSGDEYTVPDTVVSIDEHAFDSSKFLTKIVIPDGVTSIGGDAFARCAELKEVVLPNTIDSISDGIFYSCPKLETVVIPESVESIGSSVFMYCSSLTSFTIPSTVATIGTEVFNQCTALKIVDIEEGVTGLGRNMFQGCTSLETVELPESLESIGSNAFANSGLTEIVIPDSVTSLGNGAFNGCTELETVVIGEGVASLGSTTFNGCTSLTEVTIPDDLADTLNYNMFNGCDSLTTIKNEEGESIINAVDGVLFTPDGLTLLKYPTSKVGAYVIPDEVETIAEGAFQNCAELTSVTIPASVTEIGLNAFRNCVALEEVTINGAATIGDNVFNGCTKLTSVTMPNVTSIGASAFRGIGLTSVTIPASVTSIGNSAFYGCAALEELTIQGATAIGENAFRESTKLASVTMPSVTSIGANAFRETGLTSVTIPASITAINGQVFQNCTSLQTVEILGNVTTMGWGLFSGCTSLDTVTLTGSVTVIGDSVFFGCSALQSITIPASVTSIAANAFKETGLTSITIPNTVATIGGNAFQDCTALATAVIAANGVTTISANMFNGCTSLSSITIPDSVETVGGSVFVGCTALTAITIPKATNISGNAFNGCTALTAINVDNANTAYQTVEGVLLSKNGQSLVRYPSGKATTYTVPSSVLYVNQYAFGGNTTLTSVTLQDVRSISANTFYGCTSLKDVVMLRKGTMNSNQPSPMAFASCNFDKLTLWGDPLNTSIPTYITATDNDVTQYGYLLDHITVDSTLSLNNGASQTLVPNYFATSGVDTDKDKLVETPGVTWEVTASTPSASNSEPVVSVDPATGKVTALQDGTATITATVISDEMKNPAATITPEDCTVTVSTENATITKFDLEVDNKTYTGTITADPTGLKDGIITVELDPGTELTENLAPSITVGNDNGTVLPAGAQDFTTPVDYRVTYDNGNKKNDYRVTVTVPRVQPAAAIDYEAETLTGLIAGEKYTFNGGNAVTLSEETYDIDDSWFDTDISIVRTGNGGYITDSAAQELEIPDRPNAPDPAGITVTNETIAGLNNGIIEGINGDMEYRKVEADQAPDEGWTNEGYDDEISVAAGDYQIRVKAVANTSFASEPITVTVAADAQPSRVLNVTAPSFADVTAGYARPDAAALTIANSGNWQANISTVTVSGTDFEIGGMGATVDPGDEIGTWTIQPKAGLSADTYTATITVTYDGTTQTTANANVSFKVNAVVIPPPPATDTYALTVTGGTDNTNAGPYEEGAEVSITAGAAPEGQVFDKWTTSAGGSFADASKESTTFTMPAKAVTVTATYKDDPNGGSGEPGTDNPPDNPPQTDNGWVKNDDGEWEYLIGGEAKIGWLYDTNYKAWYYLASDGAMQTGWDYVGGKWYYLASNGKMQTGWVKDNGSWYYLSGNGAMVVNKWFKDTNGSWYYLSGNGKMLTGKQAIGGKAYTFKSNGVWVS